MTTFNIKGISVLLAMPAHRDISPYTVCALLQTQEALWEKGIPYELKMYTGGSCITVARSKITAEFLKGDHTKLFFIDSDMVWKPEDVMRMIALSAVMHVVCAPYTARCDPPQFLMSLPEEFEANEYGCFPIEGVGLGFTIVSREVIEKLAAKAQKLRFSAQGELVPHIFRFGSFGDEWMGEDIGFFEDIRALGYEVNLDPTIVLGHIGTKTYQAAFMDMLQQRATIIDPVEVAAVSAGNARKAPQKVGAL